MLFFVSLVIISHSFVFQILLISEKESRVGRHEYNVAFNSVLLTDTRIFAVLCVISDNLIFLTQFLRFYFNNFLIGVIESRVDMSII